MAWNDLVWICGAHDIRTAANKKCYFFSYGSVINCFVPISISKLERGRLFTPKWKVKERLDDWNAEWREHETMIMPRHDKAE